MSDNKKYYYLKLKDNFFEDEAMIILESMQDGYIYSNILMKMYLRSLKNEGKLMFNDVIPYTANVLAPIVRHSVGDVEKAVKVFSDLGLIEILDSGAIYITDIQNYVGKSSSEADRKREYRARIDSEKQLQIKGSSDDGQLSGQTSDKTPPELEIEIELELEREIDNSTTILPNLKHKHGEFKNVLLTDVELDKLKESYVDWQKKIDNLSIYIGSTGKSYKSHYLTILSWARRDKTNKSTKNADTPQDYSVPDNFKNKPGKAGNGLDVNDFI